MQYDLFQGGEPVALQRVLHNREQRVLFVEKLLSLFPSASLLTLKCNIPGPIKSSPSIGALFDVGCARMQLLFAQRGWDLLYKKEIRLPTGPEAIFALTAERRQLKELAVLFENSGCGRLFDADVLFLCGHDVRAVGRADLGLPDRRCFVCHNSSKICAGRRLHPLELVLDEVGRIAEDGEFYPSLSSS